MHILRLQSLFWTYISVNELLYRAKSRQDVKNGSYSRSNQESLKIILSRSVPFELEFFRRIQLAREDKKCTVRVKLGDPLIFAPIGRVNSPHLFTDKDPFWIFRERKFFDPLKWMKKTWFVQSWVKSELFRITAKKCF